MLSFNARRPAPSPRSLAAALAAGLIALTALSASAQDRGLRFSGQAGADAALSVTDPFGLDGPAGEAVYAGLTSIRLDARGGDGVNGKIEGSAQLRLIHGDAAVAARNAAAQTLSAALGSAGPILVAYLTGAEGPVLQAELKKLYVSIYTELADISVGRMVVNFGRGTIFSPADLFASIDTGDLALGRVGSDVIRVLVPLGDLSGLDLVAGLSKPLADATGGLRVYGELGGWALAGALFRDGGAATDANQTADADEALIVSLDAKGDVELGLSVESVLRLPFAGKAWDSGFNLDAASFHGMVGADYSFDGAWFIDLEYGVNIPLQGSWPNGIPPELGSFRGAHTFFASLSWRPDDFTVIDGRALAKPLDNAASLSLTAARTIAPGATLAAYLSYLWGDLQGNGAAAAARGSAGLSLSYLF